MRTIAVVLVLSVALFAFISHEMTAIMWDGGYPPALFKVKLTDEQGKPVQNAQVHVINLDGESRYRYPVTNYLKNNILETDKQGEVTLNHFSHGLEFGGKCWDLFFIVPMGDCDAPDFFIVFSKDGFEDKKIKYSILDKTEVIGEPKVVKRKSDLRGPDEELIELTLIDIDLVMKKEN